MGVIIDITNGVNMDEQITEYIRFGSFDSAEHNLHIMSRSAPAPSPVEVKESVFGKNGTWDFSFVLGERTFEDRPISFSFIVDARNTLSGKILQTRIENELMRQGRTRIYDSYSPGYYYVGSCVGVDVQDNYSYGTLVVNVEFDCYPFKVSEKLEGDDIWDTFNFELDVAQPVSYEINGTRTIKLVNAGVVGVAPSIEASNPMEITSNGRKVTVPVGISKNELFRLPVGESTLTIKGNGTIKFNFRKELI